jgi:hypothetical protein
VRAPCSRRYQRRKIVVVVTFPEFSVDDQRRVALESEPTVDVVERVVVVVGGGASDDCDESGVVDGDVDELAFSGESEET